MVSRIEKWDVEFYCTDKWESYASVFPRDRLGMSKRVTDGIERNNCRNRHWFGRFKRRSIVVSKCKEMVDLTMALFARFRVNGDVSEILQFTTITKATLSLKLLWRKEPWDLEYPWL